MGDRIVGREVTAKGYDNMTGVGVPNGQAFVRPCATSCSPLRLSQIIAIIAIMDDFEVLAEILLATSSSGPFEDGLPLGGAGPESHAEVADGRALVAGRLRATAGVVGFYGHDPLLTTLAGIRRQRHDLDAATRRLLAFGREFTRPRPYRLADLADAAGMSISGVRTAYDAEEIAQVAAATGLTPSGSSRSAVNPEAGQAR